MARSKKAGRRRLADLADKYDLYLRSVQSPDHEVGFFRRAYKSAYGTVPTVLREDFCGTAAVCCEWVKGKADRQAIGIDIDPVPLRWGKQNNLADLSPAARKRVRLVRTDVRRVEGPKADVLAAQNFSFNCFQKRSDLLTYFKAARRNLKRKGVMVLDVLGGPEVMEEDQQEIKSFRGYKYVWHQRSFDPINNRAVFAIHFRFPDGSELENAFVYDWRMWTLPEIRELLAEAGFARSEVYWEGTDPKTGEGNDVYRRRERAESDPAWVAYVVAIK